MHETQIAMLKLIRENQGKIPPITEMQNKLNLSTTSLAHYHLNELRNNEALKGIIDFHKEWLKCRELLKKANDILKPLGFSLSKEIEKAL